MLNTIAMLSQAFRGESKGTGLGLIRIFNNACVMIAGPFAPMSKYNGTCDLLFVVWLYAPNVLSRRISNDEDPKAHFVGNSPQCQIVPIFAVFSHTGHVPRIKYKLIVSAVISVYFGHRALLDGVVLSFIAPKLVSNCPELTVAVALYWLLVQPHLPQRSV